MPNDIKSNMPPMPPRPAPGTQTSDRYGNVISTRPAPAPEKPPAAPPAPTSDRYGNIISTPDGYVPPKLVIPGTNVGASRPSSRPTSTVHFQVHSGMDELKQYAKQQGWTDKGFTQLSIPWQEMVFTTDHWKTTQTLRSSDVPSPVINGRFILPNVPKGTEIEFALHIGVASHAPSDIGGYRERGDVWLNNGGQNFKQVTS